MKIRQKKFDLTFGCSAKKNGWQWFSSYSYFFEIFRQDEIFLVVFDVECEVSIEDQLNISKEFFQDLCFMFYSQMKEMITGKMDSLQK